ncbi:DUF86 domain-containing protein [Ramlibacter sp.]|uniref:HepT-like ribonuclease domain-containing protein n=1 Tax=Ramlibacter sp. TaxID=1917967 RepID=UPI0035B08D01
MHEAIERCQTYVQGMDEASFMADPKTQDAVIRGFEVIGEAASNIKRHFPDFAREQPDLPLGMAIGMRNALSHGYFTVDLQMVWRSIHADLPPLLDLVRRLLEPPGPS